MIVVMETRCVSLGMNWIFNKKILTLYTNTVSVSLFKYGKLRSLVSTVTFIYHGYYG
jgi:hypothetical protein